MDFAFFAVNFGYSKADYQALTATEKAFIMKAYEDKVVSDSTLLAMAVNNAINNALRKKGKRAVKLWKKKNHTVVDKEAMQLSIKQIIRHEEKAGKGWVEKIYKANGYKNPTAKGVK